MKITTLEDLTKEKGLITDGDWIETRHQDPTGEIRLIQLSDIAENKFQNKSQKFVTKETVRQLNCTYLKEGDVLIARLPDPLGRACIFPKLTQPAITAVDICIVRPNPTIADQFWLSYYLNSPQIRKIILSHAQGATRARVPTGKLKKIKINLPSINQQRQTASRLKALLAEIEKAREALEIQLQETEKLANAIIFNSINSGKPQTLPLGKVLDEIKQGIGENWADFPVLGATKDGLAPAKSPPGKKPERYKPVFPGTVFYNPMRILIGSIAFVDQEDTPGITSPDYVVLKGKPGVVDSRWFYYWLRSPLGEHCILSLARGAVRERMLFSRLSKGNIELPDFKVQQDAAAALAELKPLRRTLERQRDEITQLPQKILAQAFEIET